MVPRVDHPHPVHDRRHAAARSTRIDDAVPGPEHARQPVASARVEPHGRDVRQVWETVEEAVVRSMST
jgi:hypothetical protein